MHLARSNFNLIRILALAQIKVRYRKSIAGFLWVALNPLLLFGAQSYIFKNILKIKLDNYLLFLVSGLIPWGALVQGIESGVPVLYNSRDLLKNYHVKPHALLCSFLIDHIMGVAATFLISLSIVCYFEPMNFSRFLIMFPPAFILFITGLYLLLFFFSLLNIFFRDTKFVLSFLHQVLFFLTPIFYTSSALSSNLLNFTQYSPYYLLILPIRISIYSQDYQLFFNSLISLSFFLLLMNFVNNFIWKKVRNSFYLRL